MERRVVLGLFGMFAVLLFLFAALVTKTLDNGISAAVTYKVPEKCVYIGENTPDIEWRQMKCSFAKPPSCDSWDFCAPK